MNGRSIVSASKIFDSTIRIQILASLSVSPLTYNQLKKVCHAADGVMTFHTNKLFEAGYINIEKEVFRNRPRTTYSITEFGKVEFFEFVHILNESIIYAEEAK